MTTFRFKDYLKDYLEINRISNKDFANRIDITPKHLIDILNGECDLSSRVIDNISLVTSIPSDYIYKMEFNYRFEKEILNYLNKENITQLEYLNKYKYKYLIKESWIQFVDKEDKLEIIKDILKFLRVSSPSKIKEIDNNIYFKSKNDKPELLLLWLEKCYREAIKQDVLEYKKENIQHLVSYIQTCANNLFFNEEELISEFNKNGIALVIQEDIPGSKIRGAFKVHKDMPSIYITYKHKRIADIYFSLLHELAHCKSDFNSAKSMSFVALENESDEETRADKQAYHWMVDDAYYELIKNDVNYKVQLENNYPKSFVVYRLAKDKVLEYSSKEYQTYNQLIEK